MRARYLWVSVLVVMLPLLAVGAFLNPSAVGYAAPTLQEDCLPYNPNNLTIFQEGAVWVLSDGTSRMALFANQADAQLGLEVARQHTQHCFIGRGNTRPDRNRYIFEYWKGSSGLGGALPENDWIPYDKNALQLQNAGADGWRLVAGSNWLALFDTQADAQQALDLFRLYDRLCFIGRGTDYVHTYLYADMLVIDPGLVITLGPIATLPPAAVVTPSPTPILLAPVVTLPPILTPPPAVPVTPPPIGPIVPAVTLPPLIPLPSGITEDCIPYDPNALYTYQDGSVWVLTDGTSRMKVFASQADADLALQVARLYTEHCFIGRGNTRPDRERYIFEYWKGNSGLSGALPENDCIPYDKNALYIVDEGPDGWLLTDGMQRIAQFDNQTDAQQALDLFKLYDRLCFIGRGSGHIMTYLYADLIVIDPGIFTPLDPGIFIPSDPGLLTPAPSEDCVPYTPTSLVLRNLGAFGWQLTDTTNDLLLLDDLQDAQLAAGVALAHTDLCFIGRGNTRPNPDAYIFEYWKGASGLGGAVSNPDCTTYDPATLIVMDGGANGWYVADATQTLLLLDTQNDAQNARNILANYNALCFIGKDNARPDRDRYIHTYLRQVTATPPPTTVPTAAPPASCPGAPAPRMVVGQAGRVTFSTGVPSRLRSGPGLGYSILQLLPEGTTFTVLTGPVCADSYNWWGVRLPSGVEGWMAEGSPGNYFLEPLGP